MKKLIALPLLAASVAFGALPDRPEEMSFPTKTRVTAKGTYALSALDGQNPDDKGLEV